MIREPVIIYNHGKELSQDPLRDTGEQDKIAVLIFIMKKNQGKEGAFSPIFPLSRGREYVIRMSATSLRKLILMIS